jgi:DNA-binding NarL/FixJ family response regulator
VQPFRPVQPEANVAAAVLSALRLAEAHGGATLALQASGVELPRPERFDGLADELVGVLGRGAEAGGVAEALALGFLAGRLPARRRARAGADPTSFVLDGELVVQGAAGESIMRLPWIEDELFVGRQLPDISEIPTAVRNQCVASYSAALRGERGRFAFSSYGHAYSVDAIPVRAAGGAVEAVLAIALPIDCYCCAAAGYESTAVSLQRAAERADERAELQRRAGHAEAEKSERRLAVRARRNAQRARVSARRLRARALPSGCMDVPAITPRETQVLALCSHGLTSAEIAEQLFVSVGTIKTHLQNVYPKLGVNDKASAVAAALRHGLID